MRTAGDSITHSDSARSVFRRLQRSRESRRDAPCPHWTLPFRCTASRVELQLPASSLDRRITMRSIGGVRRVAACTRSRALTLAPASCLIAQRRAVVVLPSGATGGHGLFAEFRFGKDTDDSVRPSRPSIRLPAAPVVAPRSTPRGGARRGSGTRSQRRDESMARARCTQVFPRGFAACRAHDAAMHRTIRASKQLNARPGMTASCAGLPGPVPDECAASAMDTLRGRREPPQLCLADSTANAHGPASIRRPKAARFFEQRRGARAR